MNAGVKYGVVVGGVVVLFTRVVPQPGGSILMYVLLALQLTWGAWLVWHRTGLVFMTLSLGSAGAGAGLLAALAASGRVYPDLPPVWWIPTALLALAIPACLVAESRRHPEEWAEWRAQMRDMSLWDIIRGRHIPRLRDQHENGA